MQYLPPCPVGSILGSLCFVLVVDHVPRHRWMVLLFALLAALLFITAITCYTVIETPRVPATIICLGMSLFMFNFGPNPLNFIMPAEIFLTCYRCTCHGISVVNDSYKSTARQDLILLLFCAVAALGVLVRVGIPARRVAHRRGGAGGEDGEAGAPG